ncbi:hypothetical protein FKM82_005094, partial [Ascaphus truei]
MELSSGSLQDSSRPAASPERAEPGRGEPELDEELVFLAAESGERDLGESGGPGDEPELLSLIRQKEKDLVLAARLGKALLERNQDMNLRYEAMQRELTDRLECLEQEKHELKRRFDNREGEWEGRVSELEGDVKQLQEELEKQQVHLKEADREKSLALQELSEQNQRLLEQLSRATKMERQLALQVRVLQEEFRGKSVSANQHISRLESLLAEVSLLAQFSRRPLWRVGSIRSRMCDRGGELQSSRATNRSGFLDIPASAQVA